MLGAAPLATLGAFLVVLSALDLAKRERSEIVGGSKVAWAIALLAIPVGPIAYLWFGRKRPPRR